MNWKIDELNLSIKHIRHVMLKMIETQPSYSNIDFSQQVYALRQCERLEQVLASFDTLICELYPSPSNAFIISHLNAILTWLIDIIHKDKEHFVKHFEKICTIYTRDTTYDIKKMTQEFPYDAVLLYQKAF